MTGGVGTALGERISETGEGLPDGEALVQAALFDNLDASETGALDAPSPLSRALPPAKGGPGRPKGSRNRRTDAVAAWLLSQHRHPLAVMMEAYSMEPADLARRIGLRFAPKTKTTTDAKGVTTTEEVEGDHYSNDVLLEIVKLQLRMAEAVAPYVASKMPQAVTLDGKASLSLTLEGVNLPARGGAAGVSGDQVIDGMAVRLPYKSDRQSRTEP